ncbi:MAG: GAF domain-containing protein [Coleofasciculus sp. G3-WIS-01]|uniref:GAF domain-containing protein n=1 Tax=Coleofasciculus sp. G3-WIS-01 TaxID=3069528 RepID=UPI003302D54C
MKKFDLKKSQWMNSARKKYQPEKLSWTGNSPEQIKWMRILYETLPCIYFTLNFDGVILDVSQFGAAYLGYDFWELVQKPIHRLFEQDSQCQYQTLLTNLSKHPTEIHHWETRLIGKDGRIVWVKARIRLLPITASNSIISLVCEDMTTAKSQALPPTPLSNNNEAVFITNDKGNFTYICPQVTSIFGYSLSEVRALGNITKLLGNLPLNWQALAATGKVGNIELEITDKTGKPHTLVVNVKQVSIQGRTILYRLRDITNCQSIEDKWQPKADQLADGVAVPTMEQLSDNQYTQDILQESEARFRTMADSAPVLLWMSGTDGLCTFFNQGWLKFTGRSLEQELGNGWAEGVHSDDLSSLETYQEAFNARQGFRMEYRLRRADGDYRWILNTGTPRFTPNGQFLGYIGSCIDITDRKQTETAVQQQYLRERLIGAIAQRIHYSLDLDEILNTTVAEVRQILACDRVLVFRLYEDGSGVVEVESVGSQWKPISGTVINDRYFAEDYIHLYQKGRVQSVEDIYNAGLTDCHIELLAQFQVRANLVIPIVHEERLWGLLVAQQCQTPRKWQPWEIELLQNLSTHTAVAIQQSELYQQAQTEIHQRQQAEATLRQQVQREQLIGAITQRIRQSLNLEDILERTVAEVRQVLQTDRVIILRFNPDWSGKVVVESVDSRWCSILGNQIYDPCFEKNYLSLYQQGRVRTLDDIYGANLSQCYINLLAKFQVRANLVVPIVHSEKLLPIPQSQLNVSTATQSPTRLWGLLIAHHCNAPRKWQSFEIDLLDGLASQVAIAIQQSQLYEQAKSLFWRERVLNQVTQAIRCSLDLTTVFETTVREIGELLPVDRAQIVQYLPESQCWLSVAEYRRSPEDRSNLGLEIPDQDHPLAERLKQLEIITEDRSTFSQGLAEDLPGAWLWVPLHFNSQILGSLALGKTSHPDSWEKSEVELIAAIADQVAIAIGQSQLYHQAQYHLKREQAINHLTHAIRCSLDLETIFSTATQEIESLLQVDRAQIIQYIPERQLWVNVAESCRDECLPKVLGVEIPDTNNPLAERLKGLEVVRINDTRCLADTTNTAVAQQFPGAWLLVPLHCGNSVWGALGLMMDNRTYDWQNAEVELMCTIADQLAIALQQAELYEKSRRAQAKALTHAQQLEQTLSQLQKTQAQLVQSEKMSSLGQLVAGVAHEINNPVNFIYGNLVHASDYATDLLGLIELYQQQYPQLTPEIQSEMEAIDLEFLVEDLPKLLDSMKVGAERICEIVYSLRNFSRIAEADMKAVDIHEGINSTLMILRNRLKARGDNPGIQVIQEYGNLPQVECYAGQMNQVFMNLLVNAIDAIDEQNKKRSLDDIKANPSIIRVQTELLDNQAVAIRIIDNGPGMTEEVKQQLFHPFFTTKPVGTGTGLGLSISYQIVVEKHNGRLLCQSKLGQGTEFVVQIPVRQHLGKG